MAPRRASQRTYAIRQAIAAVLGLAVVAVLVAALLDDGGEPAAVTPSSSTTSTTAAGTTTTHPPVVTVVADPASITVLVNDWWRLPAGWMPLDLVEPAVTFTFTGSDPKRLLRQDAARALESLFAAAEADGTPLAAVSGFRSEAVQADLFDLAVARFGQVEAERRSAHPGHSEHQTGLAIDVTGVDGRCPAEACFAGTPAARWLEAHAADHGFIVRYPAGSEATTGYGHEPWHLRYVGVDVARRLTTAGIVLEELPG